MLLLRLFTTSKYFLLVKENSKGSLIDFNGSQNQIPDIEFIANICHTRKDVYALKNRQTFLKSSLNLSSSPNTVILSSPENIPNIVIPSPLSHALASSAYRNPLHILKDLEE